MKTATITKKAKPSKKATKVSGEQARTILATAATEAPTMPKDDGLGIPEGLKVENRTPLTAEQQTKVEAATTLKKEKAAKPVKVIKAVKGPSMSRCLRDLVVRTPKMPTDELVARLEKAGFVGRSRSTIATLQNDALQTLAAARDAGLYSVEMD
jgi:hypothetical protein